MTREAADVHARSRGANGRSRDLWGQLRADAGAGPDRHGNGARQDVGRAARGCLGSARGSRPTSALESGHYPYATDARKGRFVLKGLSTDLKDLHYAKTTGAGQSRSERVVVAVPKPGQPYFLARGRVNDLGEAVVDCPRGIPFRLTLRDEAGRPIEAEVTYSAIVPNPYFGQSSNTFRRRPGSPCRGPGGRPTAPTWAWRCPGPGVVVAKTPRKAGYRPAHVDPKAFFAPGKAD